ncbi:MAG: hypothetical protein HC892_03370 [Saprospiraceae bacterium]|nr:hypothetical protein [Saprospiraceae bacterium]
MTKGKDGAIYLDQKGYYQASSFPIEVVDTIGAGDAFLACFLKTYSMENRPKLV